jgi:hypothetical protein
MRGLLEFLYSGNVTDSTLFGLDPLAHEQEVAPEENWQDSSTALQPDCPAAFATACVLLKSGVPGICSQLEAAVQETVVSTEMQAGWLLTDLKTALDEFQYPERATAVFTDVGPLGLELTCGQVTRVLGQAQRLGVKVGDKFLSIAGQRPSATTDMIADQLQEMARPGTIVLRRKPLPGPEDAAAFQERAATFVAAVKAAAQKSGALPMAIKLDSSSASGGSDSESSDTTDGGSIHRSSPVPNVTSTVGPSTSAYCSSLYADADQELLVLANRYQTDGLKALAEKRLLEKLGASGKKAVTTVLQTIIFASTHEAHTLKMEGVKCLIRSMTCYTPSRDQHYMAETQQRADNAAAQDNEGDAMQLEVEGKEMLVEVSGVPPTSAGSKPPPSVAQVWLEADPAERSEVLQEIIHHLSMRLIDGAGSTTGSDDDNNNPLPKHGRVYCPSGDSMEWTGRSDGKYASGWFCDGCGDHGSPSFHPSRFSCNDCAVDYCTLCYQSFTAKPNPFVVTDPTEVDIAINTRATHDAAVLAAAEPEPQFRACPACTYNNPMTSTVCGVCGGAITA